MQRAKRAVKEAIGPAPEAKTVMTKAEWQLYQMGREMVTAWADESIEF